MTALGPDSFYSAKLRIGRAQEHLEDLEAKIDSFLAEKPYARVVDPDPDGIHEIYKIRLTKPLPFRWRILATEIIEHLRSSLDHAVWASAYLNTGSLTELNVFPFSSDPIKFENRMKGLCKEVPSAVQALVRAFKPYPGGNNDLCILNEMSGASKHVLVAFVACATRGGQIRSPGRPRSGSDEIAIYHPPVWDSLKNEIPYARVKRGFHFDHDIDIDLYVALEHRAYQSIAPATAVLHTFCSEAERVVLAIEAECRRIRLIPT
jgi:hypothetical protein